MAKLDLEVAGRQIKGLELEATRWCALVISLNSRFKLFQQYLVREVSSCHYQVLHFDLGEHVELAVRVAWPTTDLFVAILS